MTHPGEELTKAYFEMKGYLVRTNVKYKTNGSWGDLDVLALKPTEPIERVYASVKSRHTQLFALCDFETCVEAFRGQTTQNAVVQYFGSPWKDITKIVVVSELGPRKGKQLEAELLKEDIQVLETTTMLKEMVEFFQVEENYHRDYDNPLLFLLRVLSYYSYLVEQPEKVD